MRPGERWWRSSSHRALNGHGPLDAEPGTAPIVLVHPIGMSSRAMVPLLRALGPEREVFAPDLPGFGMSDAPPTPLGVPGLAAALRRWMIDNQVAPATVVAASLGSQVAVELAARNPALVERLVLVGPPLPIRRAAAPPAGAARRPRGAAEPAHDPRAPCATGSMCRRGGCATSAASPSPTTSRGTSPRSGPPRSSCAASGTGSSRPRRSSGSPACCRAPGPRRWSRRVTCRLPATHAASRPRSSRSSPRTPRPGRWAGGRAAPRRARAGSWDGMNLIGSRPDGWWRDREAAWKRLHDELSDHVRASGDDLRLFLDGRRPRDWHDDGLVETTFAAGGPNAADDAIARASPPTPAPLPCAWSPATASWRGACASWAPR